MKTQEIDEEQQESQHKRKETARKNRFLFWRVRTEHSLLWSSCKYRTVVVLLLSRATFGYGIHHAYRKNSSIWGGYLYSPLPSSIITISSSISIICTPSIINITSISTHYHYPSSTIKTPFHHQHPLLHQQELTPSFGKQ